MYIGPIQQIFHAKSPIHITGGGVKVAKCQQHMTLSLSSDKNTCNKEIKTSTGRKWKVAIGRAIAAERNWELMGTEPWTWHWIPVNGKSMVVKGQ